REARQIEVAMQIAVSHSAAVKREAIVQQSAIAIRRGLQPREEVVQELNVVDVDLLFLGDEIRVVAVMRHGVMLIRHADMCTASRAQLARKNHGEHPRYVGLVSERDEVE